MKVLVLAAGYATRLYPLTVNVPKPLLDVAGRTMLDTLIEKIVPLKPSEIVIVSNHRFIDSFRAWAGQTKVTVTVIDDGSTSETDRLGAVGDMRFAVQTCGIREDMLVVAGDNLFDFSLVPFAEDFAKHRAPLIGLYEFPKWNHLSNYGIVTLDSEGRVAEFVEKPAQPKSNLVAMCLYAFCSETLGWLDEYLNGKDPKDAPGHYIRWLMGKCPVRGHRFRGTWLDIGDKDSLAEAQTLFAKKE